jgi:DNA-binding transcriptional LysR family regulator
MSGIHSLGDWVAAIVHGKANHHQAIIRQLIISSKEIMERSDLELLLAIREQGSLVAAALHLGVAAPAVTKRLASLEARVGHRLFQRSTRRVRATAEGELACERARVLLQGFRSLEDELAERREEASGSIRLAATLGFGRLWLGPALQHFQAQHPRVSVQLTLTEHLPDLGTEGLDGAVWLWSVHERRAASQWISRRLARNQRVLVASPDYLERHGSPRDPDDLAGHDCLVVRENAHIGERYDTWTLQHARDGRAHRVRVRGALTSNSGELVRDWCRQGAGIALRSLWDVAPLIESGMLARVLPDWAMQDADVHWLAPWQARQPLRIRLLVEHLAHAFESEPWLARGSAKARPSSRAGQAAPRAKR